MIIRQALSQDAEELAEFVEDSASAHTIGCCGVHLADCIVSGADVPQAPDTAKSNYWGRSGDFGNKSDQCNLDSKILDEPLRQVAKHSVGYRQIDGQAFGGAVQGEERQVAAGVVPGYRGPLIGPAVNGNLHQARSRDHVLGGEDLGR